MEYKKYKNENNEVAIIIAPNYGSGFYTWNKSHPEILTDPELVKLILNKEDYTAYIKNHYPNIYYYGADLEIEWVPEGSIYRIREYDGAETLILQDEDDWHVA